MRENCGYICYFNLARCARYNPRNAESCRFLVRRTYPTSRSTRERDETETTVPRCNCKTKRQQRKEMKKQNGMKHKSTNVEEKVQRHLKKIAVAAQRRRNNLRSARRRADNSGLAGRLLAFLLFAQTKKKKKKYSLKN